MTEKSNKRSLSRGVLLERGQSGPGGIHGFWSIVGVTLDQRSTMSFDFERDVTWGNVFCPSGDTKHVLNLNVYENVYSSKQ